MITPTTPDPDAARVCLPRGGVLIQDAAVLDARLSVYAASPLGLFPDDNTSLADGEGVSEPSISAWGIAVPTFTARTVSYRVQLTDGIELETRAVGRDTPSVVVWLPRIRYSPTASSSAAVAAGRSAAQPECFSSADCLNAENEVSGVCIEGTCDCELPWVGSGCSGQHSCRWFDGRQEKWRKVGCRVRLDLSDGWRCAVGTPS